MVDNKILSYALIETFYEKGEDYIDCFWPFTLETFNSNNERLKLQNIKTSIQELFSLSIPNHTLRTILSRAIRKEYLKLEKGGFYSLTKMGNDYLDKVETEKEVDRRLNELFKDMQLFFKDRDIFLKEEEIKENFLSFINNNLVNLVECINSILI